MCSTNDKAAKRSQFECSKSVPLCALLAGLRLERKKAQDEANLLLRSQRSCRLTLRVSAAPMIKRVWRRATTVPRRSPHRVQAFQNGSALLPQHAPQQTEDAYTTMGMTVSGWIFVSWKTRTELLHLRHRCEKSLLFCGTFRFVPRPWDRRAFFFYICPHQWGIKPLEREIPEKKGVRQPHHDSEYDFSRIYIYITSRGCGMCGITVEAVKTIISSFLVYAGLKNHKRSLSEGWKPVTSADDRVYTISKLSNQRIHFDES